MRRNQKSNTNPICLGDWDYKSGYDAGRMEAIRVYQREELAEDYHQRLKLNISEKGTLYEEGRIQGYEDAYIEMMLCGGQTWAEEYAEDYDYDYDETSMSDEY